MLSSANASCPNGRSVLIASILASLAASLAGAGVLAMRLLRHDAAPDRLDRLAAMAGGPFAVALALYAVLALALVTAGSFRDLRRARLRMHRAVAEAPALDWPSVFAGTAFAPLAVQLVSDELRLAPLSLLRVLRAEFWRTYTLRLAAAEAVLLLLAAALVAASPVWAVLTPAAPDGVTAGAVALVLAAAVVSAWLVLDHEFGQIAMEITHAGGWWPRATPAETAAPAAAVGAADRIAELRPILLRIEAALSRSQSDGVVAALGAVAAALDRLAAAPAPRRDEIQETLRSMGATLTAVAEAVQAMDRRPRSVTDELDDLLNEISDLAPPSAAKRA